ncbi:MAG: FtsX-like permease family protein [bacterium]|nr:FtsX-like permease family protein [bacterium]
MYQDKIKKPPSFFEILLKRTSAREKDFTISGDFEELYHRMYVEKGFISANIWYIFQVLRTIQIYSMNSIIWSIMMFKNYLKVTFRNITRDKGYTMINISGLAIGMACCVMIFLWVRDELSFDNFHEKADRLYNCVMRVEGNWWGSTPLALKTVLEKDFPEIEKVVRLAGRNRDFRRGDYSHTELGGFVGTEFFEMFTFPFIAGDPEKVFENKLSIVITEEFADRFFKDEDPLGKVVIMSNNQDLTVTGVLKNLPSNSSLQFDFLSSIENYTNIQRLNNSWSVELNTYLLIRENVDIQSLREKVEGVVEKYDTRMDHEVILALQAVSGMYLYNIAGGGPITNVYIFSTIAILILLIACINFMNLATARSGKRAKEVGMRKVMGAVKSNLFQQFYSESLLSTFAALVLALILVYLFLPFFNSLAQKQLTFSMIGSTSALIGLVSIVILTGLVSGSYPSLLLSSFQPVTVLKSSFRSRNSGLNLRRILVVCQFSATLILIIGTLIIFSQLEYIRNKDLGLNKDNVVTVNMTRQMRSNYRTFIEELRNHPGIINVTAASSIPTQVGHINPVYWEGKTRDDYVVISHVILEYDYFETFEMEMAYGRSFSKEFPSDRENYIINEAALKLTGFEEPLGKRYSIWEDENEIIGVVKDFHNTSLHSAITPTVFTLRQKQFPVSIIMAKLKAEDIQGAIRFIEDTFKTFSPGSPFSYTFVEDTFDRAYRTDRRVGTIFRYFAGLAIFISCMGLFGMASFMAQERTKEIGIRKVVGASVSNIILLISREFFILLGAANLIAWPAAYVIMSQLLNNYAYRTDIAIWIFALSGISVLLVAFITVSFQTIKAAITNPVRSLRYE